MGSSKQSGRSHRVEQAHREAGRTDVARGPALMLVALIALAVLTPPLVQTVIDWRSGRGPLPGFEPLIEGLRAASRSAGLGGFNRALLTAIEESEDRLEENSWLRSTLLPPTQWVMTGLLGLGNERALAGRGGEWFYADDFEYSVGRGFLTGPVLERRWRDENVQPDPVTAIRSLSVQLGERGIALLVVPVPAKTTISPGPLARRAIEPPVHNVSYGRFLSLLHEAGVEVYDPTEDLLALALSGTAPYLRTDTHWTPAGLDAVAAAIARRLTSITGLAPRPDAFYRRPALVESRGDLVTMLSLPDGVRWLEPEQVESAVVVTAEGRPWRPSEAAEILLLGDSFTNVFSEPALGWGTGGGLAEQLSYHLGRPLDRIARNAGGAYRSRAELARALAAGRDRLQGKKAVVYEFAVRELSAGDWRLIEHPGGD